MAFISFLLLRVHFYAADFFVCLLSFAVDFSIYCSISSISVPFKTFSVFVLKKLVAFCYVSAKTMYQLLLYHYPFLFSTCWSLLVTFIELACNKITVFDAWFD